jgi:hypothetical protein
VAEHRIFESEIEVGNMGAMAQAWRAFCSCGWVSDGFNTREAYDRAVVAHLEEHDDGT